MGLGVDDTLADRSRWTSWSGFASGAGRDASRVEIKEAGPASVRLRAHTPGCFYTRQKFGDGRTYDVLIAPGASQFPIGHPNLPALAQWVLVPEGSDMILEITPGAPVHGGVMDIAPVQPPRVDSSDVVPPFAQDKTVYGRSADYPGVFAETGALRRIRGQTAHLIRLYPYQYNPVSRRLTVYPNLEVRVRFRGDGHAVPTRLRSPSHDNLLRRLTPNADAVLALPSPSVQAMGESFGGGTNGCDFLIICPPVFTNAARSLAKWRIRRGLATRVAGTDETGDTTNSIRDYIKDAYTNWDPAPSYVLLMGDSDVIPVWYATNGTPTDLFYADMDEPSDYVADLAIGRLPLATVAQAERYVSRVIEYESVRLPDAYYTTTVHAAAFQDGEDNPPDHYEERRFAKTSEDLWEYLQDHGYAPQRIYTTYDGYGGNHAAVTPSNWATYVEYVFENDGSGGLPVPTHLRKPTFPWDGSRGDIINAFNAGAFLITHRDHADGGGWSAPPFSSANVDALTNGSLRPVVFSINCLSGMFSSPFSELFCERLLRHPTGGAIGCIGSSDVSLSGRNDRMAWGWMDAIWTDFVGYFGGPINAGIPLYRMGDVLNYGKLYMMKYFVMNDDTRLSLAEFHWLGDPALEIWTGVPGDLHATHPAEIVVNETSMIVNVDEDTALVCCAFNGRVMGTAVSAGGQAVVPLPNGIPGVGPLLVTATKHNYLPYLGTAMVTRSGLDHYVSMSGADAYPYTNWATAARVLQDAIDAATNGDYVCVSNGVYASGGRVQPGYSLTNRVMVDKSICVRSMNGPTVTTIRGKGIGFNRASIRPAYLAQGARLEGFLLSGGFTRESAAENTCETCGGGVFIDGDGVVSNCVIATNTAAGSGGGVLCYRGGTVRNSAISGNLAYTAGGGVYMYVSNSQAPRLEYCTIFRNHSFGYGGGILVRGNGSVRHSLIAENWGSDDGAGVTLEAFYGGVQTAENCRIIGNFCTSAGRRGAGIHLRQGGVAINCLIASNSCDQGAGVWCYSGGTLYNCTIAGNLANTNPYGYGGGGILCQDGGRVYNSIIASNRGYSCPNWTNVGSGMSYRYCCTVPTNDLPSGEGCIEADPRFVAATAGNYRLALDSPCINAGSNAYALGATDLDGHARILLDIVDMGAYESDVGALPPHVEITNEPAGPVAFDVETFVLRGTNNAHVIGAMRVHNRTNDAEAFFPAAAAWQAPAVPLAFGGNTIEVRGTNYAGQWDTRIVAIYRQTLEEVAPLIAITSAPTCIAIEETAALIAGACSNIAGQLSWTDDSEPGVPHSFDPADGAWSVTFTGIEPGANVFTVSGTNQYGHATNASVTVRRMPMTAYVSSFGSNEYPFESWPKASHNIQPAVEAVGDGGTVWVTNGVYASGGATGTNDAMLVSSRVLIDRPVAVLSVNGPAHTVIEGAADPVTGENGGDAVRGAYVANSGLLAGFTITNGHTRDGGSQSEMKGGGAYVCERGTVSNCVVAGNHAEFAGGGIYCSSGVVVNCLVASNRSQINGGGIGINYGLIDRCRVVDNVATSADWGAGGGVHLLSGTLANSLVARNRAADHGGGVYAARYGDVAALIRNCTIVDNFASNSGGIYLDKSSISNCIVYFNSASTASNNIGGYSSSGASSCTTPTNYMPPGGPWITDDPSFVAAASGDYRLATNSPCVDAGTNETGMTTELDLDGHPRIINGTVDMGAYEVFPTYADTDADGMPDWWEWLYAHSVTNMDPEADSDGDGALNFAEYIAGMDPTDPESVFRVIAMSTPAGAAANVISWSSASNLRYTLEASTNLRIGFNWVIASNLMATPPINVYTDTAASRVINYYRVMVE